MNSTVWHNSAPSLELGDGVGAGLPKGNHSDFEAIRTKAGAARASYVAFDLLQLDGEDTRRQPIEDRRAELERIVKGADAILFSEPIAASDALRSDHRGGADRTSSRARKTAAMNSNTVAEWRRMQATPTIVGTSKIPLPHTRAHGGTFCNRWLVMVEPDGIEPTTSSMPLSRTSISDYFHSLLEFTKLFANSLFLLILVFRSFPVFTFRWRFGGDLNTLPR